MPNDSETLKNNPQDRAKEPTIKTAKKPNKSLIDKVAVWRNESKRKAIIWTGWTFFLAAVPLVILSCINFIMVDGSKIDVAMSTLIEDGILMFIGLSCAGASYIDCYFSEKFKSLNISQLKFINVAFVIIAALICILQATNMLLKNLSFVKISGQEGETETVAIMNIGAFVILSGFILIACFCYSVYTKAILLETDKDK